MRPLINFFHLIIVVFFLSMVIACSHDTDDSEVCFIGDSITYFWDLDSYFPTYNIHKHAVGGAKLADLSLWDVSDCRGLKTFLLIGTNDIGELNVYSDSLSQKQKKFVEAYMKQVARIEADPLIAISILPRKSEEQDSTVNIALKQQNDLLRKTLESSDYEVFFLDVFDLFLDEGYNLNESYFKDGVHPIFEGYDVLASEVMKKL